MVSIDTQAHGTPQEIIKLLKQAQIERYTIGNILFGDGGLATILRAYTSGDKDYLILIPSYPTAKHFDLEFDTPIKRSYPTHKLYPLNRGLHLIFCELDINGRPTKKLTLVRDN